MTDWAPNEYYRTVFRQGMSGWDVWVWQICLNNSIWPAGIVEDGDFGPKTDNATKNFQHLSGIAVDGVAGYQTQATLIKQSCNAAELGYTPKNLVFGLAMGECGGAVAAVSKKYKDGSRDIGLLQENEDEPSQTVLHDDFNPRLECRRVAQESASAYQGLKGLKADKPLFGEPLWRLVILLHNWPTAANAIAAGKGDTWTYYAENEHGERQAYKLADPAFWIESIGVQGVHTGWDWCKFYIDTKVAYITDWKVA